MRNIRTSKQVEDTAKEVCRFGLFCICLFFTNVSAVAADTTKPSDFRIYDGKLYNIQKSTLWTDVPKLDKTEKYVSTFYRAKLFKEVENGWIVKIESNVIMTYRDGGGGKTEYVVIHGNPSFKGGVTDAPVQRDRYIRTGEVVVSLSQSEGKRGDTLPIYNYGLPNTAENRKTMNEVSK